MCLHSLVLKRAVSSFILMASLRFVEIETCCQGNRIFLNFNVKVGHLISCNLQSNFVYFFCFRENATRTEEEDLNSDVSPIMYASSAMNIHSRQVLNAGSLLCLLLWFLIRDFIWEQQKASASVDIYHYIKVRKSQADSQRNRTSSQDAKWNALSEKAVFAERNSYTKFIIPQMTWAGCVLKYDLQRTLSLN